MRKALLALPVVAALAIVATPAVASAAPRSGQTVTVTCPTAGTFAAQAVGNGNGHWTPVLDLGSNAVYQPIAFPGFTFTYTLDGVPQPPLVDPNVQTKSGNRTGIVTETCTAKGTVAPYYDTDLGGIVQGTFTFDVVLKLTR